MQCTLDFTECGQPGVPPTSDQEHVTYYNALLNKAMGISVTVLISWVWKLYLHYHLESLVQKFTTWPQHYLLTKYPRQQWWSSKSTESAWWHRLYCTTTQKDMSSHTLDQYMMQSQLHYVITLSETTIIRWNVTLHASTLGKAPI